LTALGFNAFVLAFISYIDLTENPTRSLVSFDLERVTVVEVTLPGPAYKAGLAVHFPARIDPASNAKIGKHYILKLSLPKRLKKVYVTTIFYNY